MLTIILTTALILVGYHLAHGCPFRNALLSIAAIVLMSACDPALRGLSVSLYATAGLLIFAALQVIMPVVAGQRRMLWQVGRVQFAMVVS